MKERYGQFIQALTFLTILPVKAKEESVEPAGFPDSLPWFPLVGLLIGFVLFLVDLVLQGIIASPIRPVLILMVWEILTGGLHLDGLGDTVDGMAVRGGKERKLAAMRDRHFGAFATAAVVMVLLGKYAGLLSERGTCLILAPMIGRWAMMFLARISPPADSEGIGKNFAGYQGGTPFLISTVAVIGFSVCLGGGVALASVGVVAIFLLGVSWFSQSKIDGITGDVFGFSCELSELLVLIIAGR